jgi:ABC-type multidrug transport system fused ATPase/permease subunit
MQSNYSVNALWGEGSNANNTILAISQGAAVDVVNVSYNVLLNKKPSVLLKNINISIKPGKLCALMGPSGAGKR